SHVRTEVLRDDVGRATETGQVSFMKQNAARAESADRIEVVADEEHGASSVLRHFAHFPEALLLKRCVTYGQDLVDDEDLRFEMCGHGESEPDIHAAAVTLHRCVEKLLNLGKFHDLVE